MARTLFVSNVRLATAAGDRMRKYTGVMQFFHNFEHDSEGLNHCHSAGDFPYTIKHKNGKHVISQLFYTDLYGWKALASTLGEGNMYLTDIVTGTEPPPPPPNNDAIVEDIRELLYKVDNLLEEIE
ncbi:hypothetical protein LCGC14_3160160 [marine sediment metagenome]|uniref:Uncharacterized protein n=1 Tax=marine sediment metagenome TaxID=412755 RepID=A0A0F8YG04_9ZZZZ